MRKKEIKEILKKVTNERRGGAPHESWVRQSREILLMQVRNTMEVNAKPDLAATMRHLFSIFVPMEGIAMAGRAIGVFMLVLGTVFGGGLASAQVYRDAAPGDVSYKVKIAIERIQLALAPNDDYRTRLHAEFADRRIDEVARLAEQPSRAALVPQTLVAFTVEVTALESGLAALRSSDPTVVAETAKLMERKMAAYQSVLGKASATIPSAELASSRDLLDSVSIKAMAVIVEKHIAGDTDAPKTVVVTKFEEHLKVAEAKLDASTASKTTQAKAAIAETKQLLKEEKYEAALSKMEEVVQLTNEVEHDAKAETTTTTSKSSSENTSPPPPSAVR